MLVGILLSLLLLKLSVDCMLVTDCVSLILCVCVNVLQVDLLLCLIFLLFSDSSSCCNLVLASPVSEFLIPVLILYSSLVMSHRIRLPQFELTSESHGASIGTITGLTNGLATVANSATISTGTWKLPTKSI